MTETVRRALSAYYRTGSITMPDESVSGERMHDGKGYVVLAGQDAVLAVYRMKAGGGLRRMRRWPKAVETTGE